MILSVSSSKSIIEWLKNVQCATVLMDKDSFRTLPFAVVGSLDDGGVATGS